MDRPVPGGVGGIVMVAFGGRAIPPPPGPLPQGEGEDETMTGRIARFPKRNTTGRIAPFPQRKWEAGG